MSVRKDSNADTLSKQHPIIYVNQFTSTPGSATTDIEIAEAKADGKHFSLSHIVDLGSNGVFVTHSSIPSDGVVRVNFSGDPGSDAIFNIYILKKTD